ncbi:MAG: tetratricopeptide repeat protein, partial [Saccharothrix sp.]|nr:tetratricopeptide repeat protein [Saccharothrix sp.]
MGAEHGADALFQVGLALDTGLVAQAGRDVTFHGDVVIGDALPAMESVDSPAGTGRFPAWADVFVGRSAELARLADAPAAPARTVVLAVHGLGGVGKSALAARFAATHADRFSLVWWVTADSPTAIDTGLADLAVALAPRAARLPLEERGALAVRWLASHDGWLVVLDDVTGPEDVRGLLDRVRTGTVLITSRRAGGWRGVRTVPLDVLPPRDSLALLDRLVRDEWPDADLTGGERLCAELGWLPLAVEQAAAHLAQSRTTPTAYLDLLARPQAKVLTTTAEGGDPRRAVARVWHVTLDRLADTPFAGRLLRLLAWYAPDGIPRSLLVRAVDEPHLSHALGRLAAYSMITLTDDAISVHRLVQAVARTPDGTDPHRRPEDITAARDAATAVLLADLEYQPHDTPSGWPAFRRLSPHARALLSRADDADDTPATCRLLVRLSLYFLDQGEVSTAVAYLERATSGRERLFGPDSRDALAARANLAYAYRSAGDLNRAIELYESALDGLVRALGRHHPDAITARASLASTYASADHPGRAIPLYESALADQRRVARQDHPDTLILRNNLAEAYQKAHDVDRAIRLYTDVLADCTRVLGPDHPHTLAVRNNLAGAYKHAGDPRRAVLLHEDSLADHERVMGPDHPSTLVSRANLAGAYLSSGDVDRAIRLHTDVLADCTRVLGPNHP